MGYVDGVAVAKIGQRDRLAAERDLALRTDDVGDRFVGAFGHDVERFCAMVNFPDRAGAAERSVGVHSYHFHVVTDLHLIAGPEIRRLEHLFIDDAPVVDRDRTLGRETERDQFRVVPAADGHGQFALCRIEVADDPFEGNHALDDQFDRLAARLFADVMHFHAIIGLQVGQFDWFSVEFRLSVEDDLDGIGDPDRPGFALVFSLADREGELSLVGLDGLDAALVDLGPPGEYYLGSVSRLVGEPIPLLVVGLDGYLVPRPQIAQDHRLVVEEESVVALELAFFRAAVAVQFERQHPLVGIDAGDHALGCAGRFRRRLLFLRQEDQQAQYQREGGRQHRSISK